MAQRETRTLSAADGAWWRMEHPTNPMTITAVFTFAEPLGYDAFGEVIRDKLLVHPRFRQRVVDRGAGGVRWEDDAGFDLGRHYVAARLDEGAGREALQRYVGELMSTPLDPDRPLWQLHLVEGYQGASALVARVHHCISDGMSLVQLLLTMADDPPAAEPARLGGRRGDDEPTRVARGGGSARAGGGLVRAMTGSIAAVVGPRRLMAAARVGGDLAGTLARLVDLRADPRTVLRGALGREKRVAWSEPISLDAVRAIGRATGGTINDVLLSAVAGALRLYLAGRGHHTDGLTLRAVVPVNLRRADDLSSLGNKFGLVFLPLPVGEAHPIRRLVATKRGMDRIKRTPEAAIIFGLLRAFGRTTAAALVTAVNLLGRKATAVMTNVPGPRVPIRFRGATVDGVMFWVPQSGRLGLGVSILSYAGEVRIGVATDARLSPDPEAIVAAFHAALDELLASAPAAPGGPRVPPAAVASPPSSHASPDPAHVRAESPAQAALHVR
ncbi:MAG TPA: wax ester/triacylglycerol synthase family O-acyltransferase [Gemmatirosa sp.]|nr:wax ester/triacylglycerol synthase family O-acyltransferase [Gemmatirosa sp.]